MMLSKQAVTLCGENIGKYGRTLEQKLFGYLFKNESQKPFLHELAKYQNKDGGFGHGLEPDALLPYSSPLHTTFALNYLQLVDQDLQAKKMITKAIQYLMNTYDEKRNGWYAFNQLVNDYPHTPWWEYDLNEHMTPIDHHYGNPTAEIVSYFIHYQVSDFPINNLVNHLINYIEDKETFQSEHELYCFIHLYEELTKELKARLEKKLIQGINQLIEYDVEKYKTSYVPKPLDFIFHPRLKTLGIKEAKINENLALFVDELTKNHMILPPWGESFYQGDFKKSYQYWIGIQTLKMLMILNNYKKIEI